MSIDARTAAAIIASAERYYTPPECRGQIVEVSYASTEDGIIRRSHDRSDGTTTYQIALWEDLDDDIDFEPWNAEPDVPRDAWIDFEEIGAQDWMIEDGDGGAAVGMGMTREQAITAAQQHADRDGVTWYATHPTAATVACAPAYDTPYHVVAILPDGQTMQDEAHVGECAGRTYASHDEAQAAADRLDADRPDGHEDVTYVVREA